MGAQEVPVITRGIDLHRLDREVAADGLPVKLTGVVTYPGASRFSGFILDDGTRGVFVRHPGSSLPEGREPVGTEPWLRLRAGMKIEVEGVSAPGQFAPLLQARHLRVLGDGPLRPAKSVVVPELLTGSYDCQRVKLRGVVQDAGVCKWFDQHTRFSLATPDGRCEIISLTPPDSGMARLVDAEVEIAGVCFAFFNSRAELAGVRLQISNLDEITVLVPAPEDPFSVPEISLAKLRLFGIDPPSLHRRQIRGTVTLSRAGEFFYVQDGGRGVRVETREGDPLVSGDEVVIAGFVELRRHFAEVREAVCRRVGHGDPLVPLSVTRSQIEGGSDGDTNRGAMDVDGRLVSLDGRLIQIERFAGGGRLYLESEGALLEAECDDSISGEFVESLRLGSDVRLTGVCVVELSSSWPAQDMPRVAGFRLLLRSADDIVVTRLASWWTLERLWKVLAGLLGVCLCALTWVLFLHRRVEQERRARREEARQRKEEKRREREEEERRREAAKVKFSATMRERERLAADLHDTLEQALTGVAFQLETMNRLRDQLPEQSMRHLALARQILAGSREDVRRSVWNLRSNVLEGRMLREALGFIAAGLTEGRGIEIQTGGEGEEEVLPDLVAGNLLMLAKEGITNALKHSEPSLVCLTVDYEPGWVTLAVEDDGCGFDPEKAPGPYQGHFGLQGMRERALRIGGDLEIASNPGRGTRIVIRVNPGFDSSY